MTAFRLSDSAEGEESGRLKWASLPVAEGLFGGEDAATITTSAADRAEEIASGGPSPRDSAIATGGAGLLVAG